MDSIVSVLNDINTYVKNMLNVLCDGTESSSEYIIRVTALSDLLKKINTVVPDAIWSDYDEFVSEFSGFCNLCKNEEFLIKNVDSMAESLGLLSECLDNIAKECDKRIKVCIGCGSAVIYEPLSPYYSQMKIKYGNTIKSRSETLNADEYSCPVCKCSDRDRLIISYLKKIGLDEAGEDTKVLQIAPAEAIHKWLYNNCPQISYDTSDLFMEGVTYESDIQDLKEIDDGTYDVLICSHVLEHVRDDEKAMAAMKRVIKDDGQIIFLVPIDLNREEIEEEWGCDESENWRRFGQGDHCRAYSKKGLLERLEKFFCVQQLGKDYFGEEAFCQCGLTDTSTLYVLTKSDDVNPEKRKEYRINKELCENGPLVTVIMPAYNHEKFVAAAIESVINQSYKNIEFIVCDDASTDNTAAVMQQYEEYFAKSFYYKENKPGRIIPLAEEYANGKYIALMHSDDLWEKDKLAIQVEYLETHPECATCLTWAKYTDADLNILNNNIFIQPNRSRYEWMKFFWDNGNALCNPSSVSRAEYFYTERYYGIYDRQLPDFFKWIWLVQKKDIYVVPKVLTYMRRHKSSSGEENTSAVNRDNRVRHHVELAGGWLSVIRNMDSDYFVKAFKEYLLYADACTKEEIMCEKYFLMLNNEDVFIQHDAICYLNEVYGEIKEILEEKYGYTRKMMWEDELKKGLALLLK